MNAKRIKAIAKLTFLFGTPLAILGALFGSGVYCGVQNRHEITSFEKQWLGLDVEVAPPYGETPAEGASATKPDPAEPDAKTPPKPPTGEDSPTPPEQPPPAQQPPPDVTPATPPAPASPPAPPTEPVVVTPPPEPRTDPLEGPLAQRLSTPVVVSVKVLVDPELMESQPAWIDYVQRTVSQASHVYEKQFGIELRLAGVMEWSVATEGMSAEDLLEDMRGRPRESANVLLGFTSRPFDDTKAGIADRPERDAAFNGAYGVVYANPGHRNAHVRTMLHEVAHLFGATDVTDPSDGNWVAGSWMSYAGVPESQAPWIDSQNRAVVLERKDKPFRPEPEER